MALPQQQKVQNFSGMVAVLAIAALVAIFWFTYVSISPLAGFMVLLSVGATVYLVVAVGMWMEASDEISVDRAERDREMMGV